MLSLNTVAVRNHSYGNENKTKTTWRTVGINIMYWVQDILKNYLKWFKDECVPGT